MALDHHSSDSLFSYFITLTSNVCLSDFEPAIVLWHRRGDKVLLVGEDHLSGKKHYHSLITVASPKTANALTKNLVRFYEKESIPLQKGVSIKVKRVSNQVGMFHYLTKDLNDSPPVLIIGWTMSWIKEQCLENLKLIPHKMLTKGVVMLTKRNAVGYFLKYREAKGAVVDSKLSFCQLVAEMMTDGYQFDGVQTKYLFSQVMARQGEQRFAISMLMGDLNFIDD